MIDNSHYIQDKIYYNGSLVPDIFNRYKIINKIKENVAYYRKYTVNEGETPEYVSQIFYNTTDFWWLILLINDITDPYFGWLMTTKEIESYSEKLVIDEHGTLEDWLEVSGNTENEYNNFIYIKIAEISSENDNKREIYILNSEYIDIVIKDIQTYK